MIDKKLVHVGAKVRDVTGMVGKLEEFNEFTFKVLWPSNVRTTHDFAHSNMDLVNDNWETLNPKPAAALDDMVSHRKYTSMAVGKIIVIGPDKTQGIGTDEVRIEWTSPSNVTFKSTDKIADLIFMKDAKALTINENPDTTPIDNSKLMAGIAPSLDISGGKNFGAALAAAVKAKEIIPLTIPTSSTQTDAKTMINTGIFMPGDAVEHPSYPHLGIGKFVGHKILAPGTVDIEYQSSVGNKMILPASLEKLKKVRTPATQLEIKKDEKHPGKFQVNERVFYTPGAFSAYVIEIKEDRTGTQYVVRDEAAPRIERHTTADCLRKTLQAEAGDQVFLPFQEVFGVVFSTDLALDICQVRLSAKLMYVVPCSDVRKVDGDRFCSDSKRIEIWRDTPRDPPGDVIAIETYRNGKSPTSISYKSTKEVLHKVPEELCFDKDERVSDGKKFGRVMDATSKAAYVLWDSSAGPEWINALLLNKAGSSKIDPTLVSKVEPIFKVDQRVRHRYTGTTGTIIEIDSQFAKVGLDVSKIATFIPFASLMPFEQPAGKPPSDPLREVLEVDEKEKELSAYGKAEEIFGRRIRLADTDSPASKKTLYQCQGKMHHVPLSRAFSVAGPQADVCYCEDFVVLSAEPHAEAPKLLDLIMKCVECGRIESSQRRWDPETIQVQYENSKEFPTRNQLLVNPPVIQMAKTIVKKSNYPTTSVQNPELTTALKMMGESELVNDFE